MVEVKGGLNNDVYEFVVSILNFPKYEIVSSLIPPTQVKTYKEFSDIVNKSINVLLYKEVVIPNLLGVMLTSNWNKYIEKDKLYTFHTLRNLGKDYRMLIDEFYNWLVKYDDLTNFKNEVIEQGRVKSVLGYNFDEVFNEMKLIEVNPQLRVEIRINRHKDGRNRTYLTYTIPLKGRLLFTIRLFRHWLGIPTSTNQLYEMVNSQPVKIVNLEFYKKYIHEMTLNEVVKVDTPNSQHNLVGFVENMVLPTELKGNDLINLFIGEINKGIKVELNGAVPTIEEVR